MRELLPATAANTERLTKWASEFRGMHDPVAVPPAEDHTEPGDHPAGMRAKRSLGITIGLVLNEELMHGLGL